MTPQRINNFLHCFMLTELKYNEFGHDDNDTPPGTVRLINLRTIRQFVPLTDRTDRVNLILDGTAAPQTILGTLDEVMAALR